jgi:hypothetical protein
MTVQTNDMASLLDVSTAVLVVAFFFWKIWIYYPFKQAETK